MKITIDKTNIDLQDIKNRYDILNQFYDLINDALIKYDVDYIITNGNIASNLQDSNDFSLSVPLSTSLSASRTNEPYILGEFSGKKLYVDPYMRWDDNRIRTKYDRSVMLSYKINKILKKVEYKEFLEEIIIDKEIADFLL